MAGDSVFEHTYAVILAGGSGTRFWPVSRRKRPKQLLKLLGGKTLVEQAAARIRGFIPPKRTYVFTGAIVRREIIRCLPGIPRRQIVAEPVSRNTAPTLGLAAHEILRRDPEGIMVVLPSDQVVENPKAFRRALRAASRWAETEGLSVVLGFKPTGPETGYGYLRRGRMVGRVEGQKIFRVEKFAEKPPLRVARRYLASGKYLWNGGIFVWRASTMVRNLERCQPRMARILAGIAAAGGVRARAALRRLFPTLERISVDYALMEKTSNVFVVPADVGWRDVGSWAVVYELERKDWEGNVRPPGSLALDARGNMIFSPRKFVVAVGVHDLAIVETEDALLVCARDRSQDIGKAVQELERLGRLELL